MSTSGNLNDETDVKAFKKMVECAETSKPSKIATRSSSKDSTAVASCSGTSSGNKTTPLNILSLNDDVFQAILSHLTYDEVAKSRLVCYCLCWKFYVISSVSFVFISSGVPALQRCLPEGPQQGIPGRPALPQSLPQGDEGQAAQKGIREKDPPSCQAH